LATSSEQAVVDRILKHLEQGPTNFYSILRTLGDVEYRTVLVAWGIVQEKNVLRRDDHGSYILPPQSVEGLPAAPDPAHKER